MNLENFKQAYVKTISESADDSDLKNYIRSIVEEVLAEQTEQTNTIELTQEATDYMSDDEMKESKADYKKNVLPLYDENWDAPIGLSKEFADALKQHVKKYGAYQVVNHHGDNEMNPPKWWDNQTKTVGKKYIKK